MSKHNLQQLQRKSSSLNALTKKWYRKLEETGFKDIEDQEGRLKSWTGHVLHDEFAEPLPENHKKESSKIHKTSQQEYYRLVGQCLFDKTFPSKDYRKTWQLHAEGLSYKEIGRLMGLSKPGVQHRIRKMRTMFKI